MHIDLVRTKSGPFCVLGTFTIDSGQSWASMELPVEYNGKRNVADRTCILPGTYTVERLWSQRWEGMMPHVVGVLDRSDIEIHPASRPTDIEGCIGVGKVYDSAPVSAEDVVLTDSRESFEDEFKPLFDAAIGNREVITLTITEEFQAISA